MVDLSHRGLNQHEEILTLGLKFALTWGWLQGSIDQAVRPLDQEIAMLKGKVSRLENEIRGLKVEPLVQGQAQAQVQAQVQVEGKEDIVKWRKLPCVIQDLEVFPEKAPPTKVKAKIRYDSNCKFKNRDSPLDTYVKHLNNKHNINIRGTKMNPTDRDRYLPIRTI